MTATTFATSARIGRIVGGEGDMIYKPRTINGATRYPVIGCHGAGADYNQWSDASWPGMALLMAYAARNGIPGIVGKFGGDTFGNATGVTDVGLALTQVASATGCSSSKAHLVGVSMGMTLINYAINNPTKVASITGFIPACSIINAYKTNPPTGTEANAAGNFTQLIATAWGTAYQTVTDVVTNGTTTITSPTANFVSGTHVGRYVVSKAANGIAAGTTIASVTNSTTAVLSAAASTSGSARICGFAQTLPAGADLLANAATLAGIPIRLYYAPDDTLIAPSDVTAFVAAVGSSATATATAGGGHTNTGAFANFDYTGWMNWLITNGG